VTTTTSERLQTHLHDPTLLRDRGYIGGEWVESETLETFAVEDPATGEVLAELPRMGARETSAAIGAAESAFDGWRARTAADRSQILRRWAELMRENVDDLATIVTSEQGKPHGEARGEVTYGSGFLDWFAEEGRRIYGDLIPSSAADLRILVMKEPVGVTAGITPWNLPANMVTRKAAPALAAGCTMVLKPAEQTPLTALAICELAVRAGVPAGVFNVVTGDESDAATIGQELTGNFTVRKISFTGSTPIGALLLSQASRDVKRVTLELGGNSPFIVFDDADIDAAIEGLIAAKFRNAGQLCTAANRILVQESIYERFTAALVARVEKLRVGPGFEPGSDLGPLIDHQGLDKVERHVSDLVDRGGKVLVGGHRHSLGRTFYEPTVVSGLTVDSLVWADETFGPVAALMPFGSEEEAISLANSSTHGLLSYVFSTQIGRLWRAAEGIKAGVVAGNTGRISAEQAPFGGVKLSGIGREGSKYGIDEWLDIKYFALSGIAI
jgi:succinate-semialdehyde dehydrogenase / glutarate-semialdehyde dehydrogenase